MERIYQSILACIIVEIELNTKQMASYLSKYACWQNGLYFGCVTKAILDSCDLHSQLHDVVSNGRVSINISVALNSWPSQA